MSHTTHDEDEVWIPVLSPKQLQVFNCYSRALLLSGPRKTGKTIAIGHRICRHLWETPGARVAVFSKTIKNATDGGIWDDLIKIVIPEWIAAGIGFEYTTMDSNGIPGPKTDVKTKTLHFRIKNIHGGESELKLFSLDYDKDVQAKIKGTRFSMIWFSELSLFEDKDVFKIAFLQLRMPHLSRDQHMWVADTNPAEEGEDFWIYEYWYRQRVKKHEKPKEQAYWSQFALIEIFLEDNPFITQEDIDELELLYADDPDGYDRNVLGKWTKGGSRKGRHFSGVFSEAVHVIGSIETGDDAIEVDKNTIDMFGGLDPGASINMAAHILEKRLVENKTIWLVHDEVVAINENISLEEFTNLYCDKLDSLEKSCSKSFLWKYWSDDSALNVFRAAANCYDYQVIEAAARARENPREIVLQAALKPENSVKTRVQLLRQLLREQRIYVAARCVWTIKMLKECKKGSIEAKFVEHDDNKHAFDSLTYPIYMESLEDLVISTKRPTSRGSKEKEDGIIAV